MKHPPVSYPCFIPMFHTFLLRACFIPMFHTSDHFQFQSALVGELFSCRDSHIKLERDLLLCTSNQVFGAGIRQWQGIITPQANAEVIPRQETTTWIEATSCSKKNLKTCCESFIPSFIPSFILVSYMFHTIQSEQRQVAVFSVDIFVVVAVIVSFFLLG